MRGLAVGLPLLLIAVVASAPGSVRARVQGNPESAKIKNPVAATPESIAAGAPLFRRHCAVCHGLKGDGGLGDDNNPPAPNLVDSEWRRGSSDGEIFSNIKDGVMPELYMGPWGDQIKDEDIWNIVNYVRSLAKKQQ